MIWALARLTAAALAGAVALASAVPAQAETVLHRGNSAEPRTLDPHKVSWTWESNILGDLFLGLTTEAADGSIIPGAAESWTISDDGKTYTFKLRDAKWSDGEPVTADDFVYSLHRILDPNFSAEYASALYVIENAEAVNTGKETDLNKIGVRAVDPYTLEIKLKSPAPYFLAQLSHATAYPVPKHRIEKLGDDWLDPGKMVSNGAYTLAEWVPNDHVKLVKNPNFYDAANVKIDTVYYYPTGDQNQAVQRFRAGELDTQDDFASESIALLRKELPKETRIAPYLGIYYYVFNIAKNDAFKDMRVRQALSMAIDREAITDQVLKTGELPAYSFVPPGTVNYGGPAYVSWKDTPYAARVEKAKALLKEAGYGPDRPLKFVLRYNTNINHEKIARAVQAMWQRIGVQAQLFDAEVVLHYDDLNAGNFDVARVAWVADYNDAQTFLRLLETRTGPQNYGHYSNSAFDELMDRASRTADLTERGKLMAQAEAVAMEDQPVIPIYYYVSKSLVSTRISGWVDNAFNVHRTRWLSRQP
jgi:oligopeptide transport system substrate-binding protein